jgi:hypothetical protein
MNNLPRYFHAPPSKLSIASLGLGHDLLMKGSQNCVCELVSIRQTQYRPFQEICTDSVLCLNNYMHCLAGIRRGMAQFERVPELCLRTCLNLTPNTSLPFQGICIALRPKSKSLNDHFHVIKRTLHRTSKDKASTKQLT